MIAVIYYFDKMIKALLITCLASMLVLSLLGIMGRWMNVSFIWLDPLVRHLVLLSAFLGGVVATSKNHHIKIDIASKLIEARAPYLKIWLARIIDIIAMLTCSAMIYSGYHFYLSELQYGRDSFLGLHSSSLVLILPVGMTLLCLRFFLHLVETFLPRQEHS